MIIRKIGINFKWENSIKKVCGIINYNLFYNLIVNYLSLIILNVIKNII